MSRNRQKKYNLLNKKFGSWTVIYEAEPYRNKTNTYTRRRWHCKCKCGNEEDIIEQNLISGKSVQCKQCRWNNRKENIEIGKIYGNLKVLKLDKEYRNRNDLLDSQKKWLCECQCNNKTIRSYYGNYLLNSNAPRRCGKIGCDETKNVIKDGKLIKTTCSKCNKLKPIEEFRKGEHVCLECNPYKTFMNDKEKDLNKRYLTYQTRAKKKKINFELTKEEFDNITNQPCLYCGEYTEGKENVGIDRIDSNKGYIKGNCVPCCVNCNLGKYTSNVSVWLKRMRKISERFQLIQDYLEENNFDINLELD